MTCQKMIPHQFSALNDHLTFWTLQLIARIAYKSGHVKHKENLLNTLIMHGIELLLLTIYITRGHLFVTDMSGVQEISSAVDFAA